MKWLIAGAFILAALLVSITPWDINRVAVSKDVNIAHKRLTSVEDIRGLSLECSSVKPQTYDTSISLKGLPLEERKEAFIKMLLPSILIAEHDIKRTRAWAIMIKDKISAGLQLSSEEKLFLNHLKEKYRTDDLSKLITRLNIVPRRIVLAQAALESGWGTSRFFVEGNNTFGIWTFKPHSGIKMLRYKVWLAKYDSVLQSVEDYFYNINVGWAYEDLRRMRLQKPDPLKLVSHLDRYSILKKEYIKRLRRTMVSNNFNLYDACRIDPKFITL